MKNNHNSLFLISLILLVSLGSVLVANAVGAFTSVEIIDSTGDGAGNGLDAPYGTTVDSSGNVYVPGSVSDNAFKITPDGIITEIIDSAGDGTNGLDIPSSIAVDSSGRLCHRIWF